MKTLDIMSYNVNGIRAAIKKGFMEWLDNAQVDVLCVQETKANPSQVPVMLFEELGYRHFWYSAQKPGYSGVAIYSKLEPDNVVYGCGIEPYDREGRVIRADFGNLSVVNTYFPSGSSGDARQAFKMQFLDDYLQYIDELRRERPHLLVCGDYNICHRPIDIHNPVQNANTSGFKPEEREWMSQFFDTGMVDTFRHFHEEPHRYSWWSYRANARANNKGWRIDYISATENLRAQLLDASILPQVKHSDHCPVYVKLDAATLLN